MLPVPPPPSAMQHWMGTEQTRALYRHSLPGVLCAGMAGVVLAGTLANEGRVSLVHAAIWSVALIVEDIFHVWFCYAFRRADAPGFAWQRWLNRFTWVALFQGGTWFVGALWLTSPNDITQELVAALVFGMVALAAMPIYGKSCPAYLAFMVPTILPHLGYGLFSHLPLHSVLAALCAVYLVVVPVLAWFSHDQFMEGLRLRFENLTLIENLRLQKERADQANRAKSTFLASASHDLRQPIHALSMFIGALRGQTMSSEARRLVEHISASISATDDLFAALLDISKLDAGVVVASVQPVVLGPLMERLGREYGKEAEQKGVNLRVIPSAATLNTDPVLLERVLRNLLSNAVRYTNSGRVVLGCRRLHSGVRIEVWDTGCGIAPDEQSKVFDEFYQIGNSERDRLRGLGLGLAIVHRTVPLIGGTLALDSKLGSGSVFKLSLPRAMEGASRPTIQLVEKRGAMRKGLIVVVDDEVTILNATSNLLNSWGHRTIVACSGDEMLHLLGDHASPPDLILCDYRLRSGESGLEVIDRLRQVHGAAIPALLITGDTAPDRIREANEHDVLVLHKPLATSKLRAAVGNLLRRSALSTPPATERPWPPAADRKHRAP